MPTTNSATDVTKSSVHLDAVRGLAALVVVLGHTRDLFFSSITASTTVTDTSSARSDQPPAAPPSPRISVGDEAVMIFFVLSGFLVGGSVLKSLRRKTWSWKSYLTKRLTRLWVVLLPALLLGVALDHLGLRLFSSRPSIYSGPAGQSVVIDLLHRLSAEVVLGNVFFLQKILVSTAGTNESLWSLTNEFWYYIAFPALLLTFATGQKVVYRVLYGLAFLSIAYFVGPKIAVLFFIWVLGALLATVPLHLPQPKARVASIVFTILLPVVFVVIRRAPLPVYLAECLVALYFTALMYLLLHQVQPASDGLYNAVAGFLSRISYTLYLVHLPLAVLLCALIDTPWHHWSKSPLHLAIYTLLNLTLVAFAWVFYLLFEARTDAVRRALFPGSQSERHLPTSLTPPGQSTPA